MRPPHHACLLLAGAAWLAADATSPLDQVALRGGQGLSSPAGLLPVDDEDDDLPIEALQDNSTTSTTTTSEEDGADGGDGGIGDDDDDGDDDESSTTTTTTEEEEPENTTEPTTKVPRTTEPEEDRTFFESVRFAFEGDCWRRIWIGDMEGCASAVPIYLVVFTILSICACCIGTCALRRLYGRHGATEPPSGQVIPGDRTPHTKVKVQGTLAATASASAAAASASAPVAVHAHAGHAAAPPMRSAIKPPKLPILQPPPMQVLPPIAIEIPSNIGPGQAFQFVHPRSQMPMQTVAPANGARIVQIPG